MNLQNRERIAPSPVLHKIGQLALFLHDVDGKAAVLAFKVYVLDTAVLKIGSSLHAEAKAIFLQLLHRSLQVGGAHCDVAVLAQKWALHALEIVAGKLGLLSVAGLQVEQLAQQQRQLLGLACVVGVDADVLQLKRVFIWCFSCYFMGKISTAPTVSASRRMKYCGMVNFQNSVIL